MTFTKKKMLLYSFSSMVKCCHLSLTNKDAKNNYFIVVAIFKGNIEKFKKLKPVNFY